MAIQLTIEFDVEEDGRHIAAVPELPGCLVYGATKEEAGARVRGLALHILADQVIHGERDSKDLASAGTALGIPGVEGIDPEDVFWATDDDLQQQIKRSRENPRPGVSHDDVRRRLGLAVAEVARPRIVTAKEYEDALAELERLDRGQRDEAVTLAHVKALGALVEAYEEEHFPIRTPSPEEFESGKRQLGLNCWHCGGTIQESIVLSGGALRVVDADRAEMFDPGDAVGFLALNAPNALARVEIVDGASAGQWDMYFCSTVCLRKFLIERVDALDVEIAARASAEEAPIAEDEDDERYAPLLAHRIPRESIVVGRAYVIHARHGGVGVAVEKDGLMGYRLHRTKWDETYLSTEFDWEDDPNFGTAIPLAVIDAEPPTDRNELLAWLAVQTDEHRAEIDAAWETIQPGIVAMVRGMRSRPPPITVFLDDVRDTPDGWVRTHTAGETIELLKGGNVVELSLDHDLGDDEKNGTGYDVCVWIEEQVALHDFVPPIMRIHSANSVGRERMQRAIESIERLRRREPP